MTVFHAIFNNTAIFNLLLTISSLIPYDRILIRYRLHAEVGASIFMSLDTWYRDVQL